MEFQGRRLDYYAGAFVALIGAGAALVSSHYRFGSLTSMGPGFFPTVLGILLILLGIAIAAAAMGPEQESAPAAHGHPEKLAWDLRGWFCIIAAPTAFILLAEEVGFLIAAFTAVFISALGDRTATLKGSAMLATGMTAFAIVLFIYILQVEIPIVRGL